MFKRTAKVNRESASISQTSTFKLDETATRTVQKIAEDLGMDIEEVIRNGVALMNLYTQLRDGSGKLFVEENGQTRQLIIGKQDAQKLREQLSTN